MESMPSPFSLGPVTFAFVPVPMSDGSMRFVSHTILRAYDRYTRECHARNLDVESLHVWLGEAEGTPMRSELQN
jgi:hypothetical protein